MRFSVACTVAFVASLASANPLINRNQGGWEFPESMPLVTRQDVPAPGTPAYLCHENCGKSSPSLFQPSKVTLLSCLLTVMNSRYFHHSVP